MHVYSGVSTIVSVPDNCAQKGSMHDLLQHTLLLWNGAKGECIAKFFTVS